MNLLFDLKATQPNTSGKRHGGGKYGEMVFYRMIDRGIKFSCFYDSRRWLNPQIANLCKTAQVTLFDLKEESIEGIIRKNDINRIYSALPGELVKLDCCEVYGTIHGLRELETPFDDIFYKYKHTWKDIVKFSLKKMFLSYFHAMKKKQFKEYYIDSRFHIITVSNHSKYALYSYFPELKGKDIPVFYSPNTSKEEKVDRNGKERYFMLVSGNRWEKNNLRAIIAFDHLISAKLIDNSIRMKITGAKKDNYKYKLKNPDSFDFLGYVDEDELEKLYANAFVFVYPSLNEGFGYPPLEAMKYGVPVIASPLSSIPEVCGGSVIYFNPFSIEELMNRMMMIIDEQFHTVYSERGYNQYLLVEKRQKRDIDLLIDHIFSE